MMSPKVLRKVLLLLVAAVIGCHSARAQEQPAHRPDLRRTGDWQQKLHASMPLLGHRNWILIVDSAYPLQTSPGVETLETGADQLQVTRQVMKEIAASIHVRPIVLMDSELAFVPDADAPGASDYRTAVAKLLPGDVQFMPHDSIIQQIDEAGKTFHVLVLKTNMAIPYTSVFIRLDCKYWGADAEKRLRKAMADAKH
jgi:hypothetical protein